LCARQQWIWDAFFLASPRRQLTVVRHPRPLVAYLQAGEGLVICLTSFGRPVLRSASALNVGKVASGFFPAAGHDGGNSNLRLGSGEREEPIWYFLLFSEVFSAYARDPCGFFLSLGSFVTMYPSSVILI
jgi:hypothetical protein